MDLVNIGTIVGTHHLNGTVKVTSVFVEFSVITGEKVILEKAGERKLLTVKSVKRMNPKKLLVDFAEIEKIDEAKALNGFQIKIRRSLLPDKNEEDFYLNDLFGMKVYEGGEYLGDVTDTMETAAHNILIVQNEASREIMIPMVDNFVKEIDFENNKIIVELIEGMK